MIHLALRDLGHDRLAFGFSVLGLGVLTFAFLLLIPASLAVSQAGQAGDVAQNLILVESEVLQPEESRIAPGLAQSVAEILGGRLDRIDPVIFRILRVETYPIQLRGVDVAAWQTTFRLQLLDGAWPANDSQVVIGQLTARGGGWGPGSDITIYGTHFRVAGVADGPGTKAQTVWMSYAAASALFGPGQGAQLLVAHLAPSVDPVQARQALEDGLRRAGAQYDVYLEDALLREYGAALNDLRALSALMAVIAILAVSLGSHNLAWLAADERRHSLGVLRAIGFDRRGLARFLLYRAGAICLVAYGLAVVAAIAFIDLGIGADNLTIGTQVELTLSPSIGFVGLLLTFAASLAGTWLSVRRALAVSPASLLGRGPGSNLA